MIKESSSKLCLEKFQEMLSFMITMRPTDGNTALGGKLTQEDIKLLKKTLKNTFGTKYATLLDTVLK